MRFYLIPLLLFTLNCAAQTTAFLELKVNYSNVGMSDGKIVPHVLGNYPNPFEFHYYNGTSSITGDSLYNLDETYFSSPIQIYAIDEINYDTVVYSEIPQLFTYGYVIDIKCDSIVEAGADKGVWDNFSSTFSSATSEIYISEKPSISHPDWQNVLVLSTTNQSYISYTSGSNGFRTINFIVGDTIKTTYFIGDFVNGSIPFNVFVDTSPSSSSSCTSTGTAYIYGATPPLQFYWDGIYSNSNIETNLCPGMHTLKVVDSNSDSTTALYGVADSSSYFSSGGSPQTDTVYLLVENCTYDYTTPTDSAALNSVVSSGPNSLVISFSLWQGGNETIMQDTGYYLNPLATDFVIDITVFCYTKTISSNVLKAKFTHDHPDLNIIESNINSILFFPNPANDFLKINGQFESYTIINEFGQVMLSGNSNEINASEFANGIYIIEIKSSNSENVRQKFIVQH